MVELLDHRFRTGRSSMLFVVGHMRSGSTLLVHILSSNPEVIGYGETHFRYGRPGDFAANAFRIYRSFSRVWPNERYVLDKVLGRKLNLTPDLLASRSTRAILLVRRPDHAIASILALGLENQSTPELALANYVERLEDIAEIARRCSPDRWCWLRYEDLTLRTGPTLDRLTAFLGLEEPLREEYDRMWSTGRRRIGDPSETIHAGRVVQRRREYPDPVPAAVLERGRAAFEECLATCARYGGRL